jgi:hypothetical protein
MPVPHLRAPDATANREMCPLLAHLQEHAVYQSFLPQIPQMNADTKEKN